MQALSLNKGENVALDPQAVAFHVASQGPDVDVSALLLGPNGKVRSDADLVFHRHLSQDGVRLSSRTVTADLRHIPADVVTVAVVASIDSLLREAVFTTPPVLTVTQDGGTSLTFTPPPFVARETVVVLAEVYRRGGGWKVRAVGQGYASGLAGLAIDYGVDIESEPPTQAVQPAQPAPSAQPAQLISSTRSTRSTRSISSPSSISPTSSTRSAQLPVQAPALLAPKRQADEALARTGAAGKRASVYLILDHDWAMQELYESFAVQTFSERVLALSLSLDDDGSVPVIFSTGNEPILEEISLDNYQGRIGQLHTQLHWGWGNVGIAMRLAADHYERSGATAPAFVIVQVGDEPWDKPEFRTLLQNSADLGVFWLFVGFGRGKLAYYKNLNASSSAGFTNVAFYEVGKNPEAVPEDKFYGALVDAFGAWMNR